jgi:IS5 family transposase
MEQISLIIGFGLVTKRTFMRAFIDEIDKVIPWSVLLALIAPHTPKTKTGRPPFAREVILRIHQLQKFFGYSDPAMEDSLPDVALSRQFARLNLGTSRLPDESSILRFLHLPHDPAQGQKILDEINAQLVDPGLLLKAGTIVDATLISAPCSTKNDTGERDPEMHQTKKGNQWYHSMKARVGFDARSDMVHTLITTAFNEHGITQATKLSHGENGIVFTDSGYRDFQKREKNQEHHPDVNLRVAMMPSQLKSVDMTRASSALVEQLEKLKASVRAQMEDPHLTIMCKFGHRKTRYWRQAKNTMRLLVMFPLSHLRMVRKRIFQVQQA